MSRLFFILASIILALGVFQNMRYNEFSIGGTGTMSMNTWYLLALVLYAASIAAEVIWGRRALVQPTVP